MLNIFRSLKSTKSKWNCFICNVHFILNNIPRIVYQSQKFIMFSQTNVIYILWPNQTYICRQRKKIHLTFQLRPCIVTLRNDQINHIWLIQWLVNCIIKRPILCKSSSMFKIQKSSLVWVIVPHISTQILYQIKIRLLLSTNLFLLFIMTCCCIGYKTEFYFYFFYLSCVETGIHRIRSSWIVM